MKSKLTITVASILSVLVLVGVGFAAWVISNPNVKADQTGSITAETVSDKSYTLEAVIAADDKIVFAAPETPDASISTPWLTNPTKEDLTATLTLTIKYNDWNYVPENFSVTMKTNKEGSVFKSLREGVSFNSKSIKIIDNPTISYGSTPTVETVEMNGGAKTIAKGAFENDTKTSTAKLTVTITFKWGTNGNPYNYYNKQDYTQYREEAKFVLDELYKLNSETYTITISGTTNVSAT